MNNELTPFFILPKVWMRNLLNILVGIEKSRSITAVAEALYMIQQALTYRIQQIEQKLNAKLFNRGRTGIHLTKEGLIAIQEAHHMLHQLEQLCLKLTQIHSKIHGNIWISVVAILRSRYRN